jgi:hypothetical protein
MKTTGNTHRRIPLNRWPTKPNTKNSILERIQTITHELGAIQAEMEDQLADPVRSRNGSFLADSTAQEALNLFKAELDQLRRILWFYIEEAARGPLGGADKEQQTRRIEHFTGLLRALSPQNTAPLAPLEQSGSFFERLNVVIDTYMQKKPAAGEGKTALPRNTKAFS